MSLSCMSGFPRKPLFVWLSEKTDGLMAQLLNVNGGETIWEGDNAVYPIFHNVRDTYHRKQTYLNCGNECNYRNRLRIERYGLILDIREDADLGNLGNASSGILAVVNSLTCPNKHGVLGLPMLTHAPVVYASVYERERERCGL